MLRPSACQTFWEFYSGRKQVGFASKAIPFLQHGSARAPLSDRWETGVLHEVFRLLSSADRGVCELFIHPEFSISDRSEALCGL